MGMPEYSSIRKEFIKNLDGVLQNDVHLKSSFDKTKYIFDQSIWECNGHCDHIGFQILRLSCVAYGICAQGETLSSRFI